MSQIFNGLSNPKVAELLTSGAVGAIPTDTIYGLACAAGNEAAVQRLYQLKSRDHKPGTLIAGSIEQLVELGLKARYLKAAQQFWPGSVSVVIPSHELSYIHLGKGGIAVRIPDQTQIQALLRLTGPLLTSSANQPGKSPANTLEEAQKYFGGNVDFYVDGGDLSNHVPSTVIRIIDDAVEVLRPGAVTIDEETGRIIE